MVSPSKMSPDQHDFLTALRQDLSAFTLQVRRRNKDRQLVVEAISDHDGGGKIFEAFLLFRIRANIQSLGYSTEIRDAAGHVTNCFILRGAPGHLKAIRQASATHDPGFIAVLIDDHEGIELHNSVEWPDHLTGGGDCNEFDISAALVSDCLKLVRWYRSKQEAPSPLLGIEAKFHGAAPGKNLAREVTGLATRMRTPLIYLVSAKPAPKSVERHVKALTGLTALGTEIIGAAAVDVSMSGGMIDASRLDIISDAIVARIRAIVDDVRQNETA